MTWCFDSVPKEPDFTRVLEQMCEIFKPKVFWDVGANLGWFTWLVNRKAGIERAVLFEPLPLNARLLGETIKRNGFTHARIVQAAVSDQCGEVSFKELADFSGLEGKGGLRQVFRACVSFGPTSSRTCPKVTTSEFTTAATPVRTSCALAGVAEDAAQRAPHATRGIDVETVPS